MNKKIYSSKLLFIGEYTVLMGGRALATPLSLYSGQWSYGDEQGFHQRDLKEFSRYLQQTDIFDFVDAQSFGASLLKGLYFDSNIPEGYGMGSSGALCAALLDSFGRHIDEDNLVQLKEKLGRLESYFHESSSGFDPLISFVNQPILVHSSNRMEKVEVKLPRDAQGHIFLVDTGHSRKTGPLVHWFTEAIKDKIFERAIYDRWIPATDKAIEGLLEGDFEKLKASWLAISTFQFKELRNLITPEFREVEREQDGWALKLCGAGGGGFMLGLCWDEDKTRNYFSNKGWNILPLTFLT
jgi:mevalonate kinase